MNFLEKLDYLMKKNKLNKSTLSKACDIPYTTIDGWYKKGYEGLKLTTLRKLVNYFGTTLDFWANDDAPIEDLQLPSPLLAGEKGESDLLKDYRALNIQSKAWIRGVIKGLAMSEKIANKNGETLQYPTKEFSIDEITEIINSFEPEYQQAFFEFIKEYIEDKLQSKENAIDG